MSDSNRTSLRFVEEVTYGTSPTTSALQELRMTGESLSFDIENIRSAEIRDDRQISDLVQTGAENGGGINFELSYGTYDTLFEGAFWSDWGTAIGISATNVIAATASGFTHEDTGGFSGVVEGQWIKVGGFTADTAINTYYLVTDINDDEDELTTSPVPSSTEAISPDKTITIDGEVLRNGTTEHFYTLERKHADLSPNVYFAFSGMEANQLSMSIQASSIVTGSFDFIGETCAVSNAAVSSGSITDATTTDIINAVANVGNILENDTVVDTALIQGIEFNLNNNIRGRKAIGVLGNADLGVGECSVTGSMNCYFQDKDLYAKYVAGTESSLSFKLTDADGNVYIITFHRIKFGSAPVNADSANSDVMVNLSWEALRHTTYDCTIQIDRFAA